MRNLTLVALAAIILVVMPALTPLARAQGTRSILFDESHSEYAGGELTDTTSKFGALAAELQRAGYTFDSLQNGPITYGILSKYSVLAVLAPFTPPKQFTVDEMNAVKQFINNGGGLFIAALGWSWTAYAKVDMATDPANQLGSQYGITVLSDIIRDPTNNAGDPATPIFHSFASHPVTTGLSAITVGVPSALRVSGSAQVIASGDSDSYTDESPPIFPAGSDPPFVAVAESGSGRVVYVGHDGLFYGDNLYKADNLKFALNIFSWLAESSTTQTREENSFSASSTPSMPSTSSTPSTGISGDLLGLIVIGFSLTALTVIAAVRSRRR